MLSFYTKRDIKDVLVSSGFNFYGRQSEMNFISHLIDIHNLPSQDPRFKTMNDDIIQHTVNNDDWDKDWIFEDSRVNLFGDDQLFIEFIERIFHPDVREKDDVWKPYLEEINTILKKDNLSLVVNGMISGRSIYKIIEIDATKMVNQYSEEVKYKFGSEYINSQIDIMLANVEHNPNVAIGKAKELIESTAKSILNEMRVEFKKDMDFTALVKLVIEKTGLSASNQSKDDEAGRIAAKILGNFSGVSKSMSELRNAYGDGHGKTKSFKSLPPRYARLAVGTAVTVVYFLWETYEEKKANY